ncbi:MAG: spore photoproduct lyase family protein, partial [Pseudomonadota bacterium]
MIDTLYIERAVDEHPRVLRIKARFPQARVVYCDRYGEVFNRKSQNFRLQKQRPALILAAKHGECVLPAPAGYGIGGAHNYYFSHMLNCVYDCRYCFLQGMYNSAHYVLFVNYEDFYSNIDRVLESHGDQPAWFFSGYDCDSLALEPVTSFVDASFNFFAKRPRAQLELRTKSTQIRSLLCRDPLPNCIVAFSLNPASITSALEHKTPSLEKRIEALVALQQAGWPIGLRFDPLIYCDDYRFQYTEMFERIFSRLDATKIHSISLGVFRLP